MTEDSRGVEGAGGQAGRSPSTPCGRRRKALWRRGRRRCIKEGRAVPSSKTSALHSAGPGHSPEPSGDGAEPQPLSGWLASLPAPPAGPSPGLQWASFLPGFFPPPRGLSVPWFYGGCPLSSDLLEKQTRTVQGSCARGLTPPSEGPWWGSPGLGTSQPLEWCGRSWRFSSELTVTAGGRRQLFVAWIFPEKGGLVGGLAPLVVHPGYCQK